MFEPLQQGRRDATMKIFGRALDVHLQFDRAETFVCLDSDPLGPGPHQVAHARAWSERRRAFQRGEGACRLFVAEAVPSLTGLMAEERVVGAEQRMGVLLCAVAAGLGLEGAIPPTLSESERPWVDRAVAALRERHVAFRADPTIWDGRYADNAWLQETPKPFTKITWGNVIAVAPVLAQRLSLANGDEVTLELDTHRVTGAVWIMAGQEAATVGVTFGYGRVRSEIARGLGYNAHALRTSARPWRAPGATLAKTGARLTLATTQMHQAMDGFDFVRSVATAGASVPGRRHDPPPGHPVAPSFYPARRWDSPSWGMAVDLDTCIGCNACVVACVAENNVPMVGRDLVAEGREMHWLRIDHYYEGDPSAPKAYVQPVPCMHCEQAPCEMGCPVNAAVHSSDDLNLQVYNRCIGTRTCSAFCPYKVRRFNWFDFTAGDPPEIKALRNPEVTVRSRGVMEKCTYCIQRISSARIAAKKLGRPIRDGEVVTACQQACPTKAISFGDVMDPESAVSRQKASPRNYALIEEANTWPRTTYLARIETGKPEGSEPE